MYHVFTINLQNHMYHVFTINLLIDAFVSVPLPNTFSPNIAKPYCLPLGTLLMLYEPLSTAGNFSSISSPLTLCDKYTAMSDGLSD